MIIFNFFFVFIVFYSVLSIDFLFFTQGKAYAVQNDHEENPHKSIQIEFTIERNFSIQIQATSMFYFPISTFKFQLRHVEQEILNNLKNTEVKNIHYLHYIMEIYIVYQQILFNIINRKLTHMGCHIRKQEKPIILESNKKNNEYIYQLKNQGARKMLIYQWGEINLYQQYHYEKKKHNLNKYLQQLKRFQTLPMSLYLCYFIWNYMCLIINLSYALKEKILVVNFLHQPVQNTKLQINAREYTKILVNQELQ
ncbi:unnamed protein product [Paramecium octaurelia]|uniref:Transmembrane protein n=1 Tax=Paramecium octaurelia TaxID=43137 RepID=A0A8S1SD85_PAROT|nr:unnamed protein product [Paramecium octaurelia]